MSDEAKPLKWSRALPYCKRCGSVQPKHTCDLRCCGERIGNAVPVGAAKAIAESLLTALLAASLGSWTLGSTGIWVERAESGAAL